MENSPLASEATTQVLQGTTIRLTFMSNIHQFYPSIEVSHDANKTDEDRKAIQTFVSPAEEFSHKHNNSPAIEVQTISVAFALFSCWASTEAKRRQIPFNSIFRSKTTSLDVLLSMQYFFFSFANKKEKPELFSTQVDEESLEAAKRKRHERGCLDLGNGSPFAHPQESFNDIVKQKYLLIS